MKFNAFILLFTLFLCSYSHDILIGNNGFRPKIRRCDHSRRMYKKQYAGNFERDKNYRKSASIDFENMRIYFDYTYTLNYEKKIISELIIPSVKKFLQTTLSVRRVPGKIRFPKTAEYCGELPVPKKYYKNGKNADLVIFISTHKGVKKYNEMILSNQNNTSKNNTNQNITSKNNTNQNDTSPNNTNQNITSKNNINQNNTSKNNTNQNNTSKNNTNQSSNPNQISQNSNNIFESYNDSFFINNLQKDKSNEDLNFDDKDEAQRKRNKKLKKTHENEALNSYIDEFNKKGKLYTTSNNFFNFNRRVNRADSNNNNSSNSYSANVFTDSTIDPEEMSGVVGYSMQCLQDIYTLRPLAGQMHYVAKIQPTQRSIEEAIWTTIHEITHILAMDFELYSDYIDEDYNTLGYSKTIQIKSKFKDLEGYIQKVKNLSLWIDPMTNIISTDWNISHFSHSFSPVANLTKTHNDSLLLNSKTKKNKEIFTRLETQEKYKYINVTNDLNITVLILTIENFFENVKIYLKTPKLVQAAKAYYKCNRLTGVELEHFGGPGSAFSHWSKRVLNTEFMIADSYGENYISNITLSLLEDTGWYSVNYETAQNIIWGKNRGCDFLNKKCISKTKKQVNSNFNLRTSNQLKSDNLNMFNMKSSKYKARFPEYCTNFNQDLCSLNKIFRGTCYLSNFTTPVPKSFQYFDDPRIAGPSEFGDFCPIPLEWTNPFTGLPFGSCRNGMKFYTDLGENICENCRCYMSTLVPVILKNEYAEKVRSICYESKCKRVKNKVILTIMINDVDIVCPEKGGIISIDNFDGYIECPSSRDVCVGQLLPSDNGKYEYSLFKGICEKLLKVVLDFIDWLYKK